MGKWFGLPDSNAAEWWNRPAARIVAGVLGVVLLIAMLAGCGRDADAERAYRQTMAGYAPDVLGITLDQAVELGWQSCDLGEETDSLDEWRAALREVRLPGMTVTGMEALGATALADLCPGEAPWNR